MPPRRASGRSTPLARTAEDPVGDSGLWQHLAAEALSAGDFAVLVGAVSDNLATNTLLRHVGSRPCGRRPAALGLRDSALLEWFAPPADLSMVASALGFDPLAHVGTPTAGCSLREVVSAG